MMNNTFSPEGTDTLITPNLQPNQLPQLLEEALSVAPEGEMRDMLLLSLLTNCAYALPAMRMLHGHPHHIYSADLLTMVIKKIKRLLSANAKIIFFRADCKSFSVFLFFHTLRFQC